MKKHLLLITVALCSAIYTQAQWVTIPDSNFVAVLTQQYPGCMNGNQMDTTCSAIVNETTLTCSHAGITDLNGAQYFDNLKQLDASINNLISPSQTLFPQTPFPPGIEILYLQNNPNLLLANINLPAGLIRLYCGYNTNGSLPVTYPPSLVQLDCSEMYNVVLGNLPNSLNELDCWNTIFQYPPSSFPPNLQYLATPGSNLTSLPALPASLEYLYCGYNNMTYLPALPSNLKILQCDGALLSYLPPLPQHLEALSCKNNLFTSFNLFPASLSLLDCSNNNLVTLPTLPPNLTYLYFDGITTSYLPSLPASLQVLSCNNDQLNALPQLPGGLERLDCGKNLLTSLPVLPPTLRYLTCSYNSLSNLPELPDSLIKLDCRGNPNLHCLPQLKYINELYIDTINFQCIPNYGHIVNDYYRLLRKPLCNLFNNNGCPRYWNITGEVYKDDNNNCSRQVTETRASNTKLMLYRNGSLEQETYTYSNGLYSFDTDTGIYTVKLDTTGLPFIVSCPANGTDTARVIPTDSMLYNNNFALQCKPGFDLGINSLLPRTPFRPAFYTSVKLNSGDLATFYNQTCNTTGLSGALTITLGGPVSFAAPAIGALTPTTIAGNIITYNISDWSAVNPVTAFNFVAQTDTFAQLTQQVCIDVAIQPTGGDNVLSNNTFNACYPILTSFDPNEKEVQPKGVINNTPQWLTYTIRFQNTGTAPAQHIFIEDTLSSHLDLATFQLLNYSHEPLTQLYNINNRLRFNFPNIELPDSLHNEADSHGYVQFRIKTKPGLNCGDSIADPAYIYFDYNAPVVTDAPVTGIKYSYHCI